MTNILNSPVSYYKNIKDVTSQQTVILYDFLTKPIPSAEQQLKIVRSSADKKTLDEAKSRLPYITPAGTFSHRDDTSLITFSGLIQIDMDRKDNTEHPDWESVPIVLKDDPHIAYVGRSASGGSYWGLIPITDPDKRVEHWEALHHHFIIHYGIHLDPCTKPISQPRYYSFDPHAYLNPQAVTFTQVMTAKPAPAPPHPVHAASNQTDRTKFDTYVRAICEARVDITGDRKQWIRVGEAIKAGMGDDGLDAFIDICKFSPLFDEADCHKAYRSLKPTKVTISTFYYLCHEHGVQPDEYKPRIRVYRPKQKNFTAPRPTAPSPAWVITKPRIASWLYDTDSYVKPPKVEVEAPYSLEGASPHPPPVPIKYAEPPPIALLHGVEECSPVTSQRLDDDRPHVPFTMSGIKKITALLSGDNRLFIDTPPSYHTFTVYSSIEAYNTRSERPTFIAKDEVDGQDFTVVFIELNRLIIQPPASCRANFTL